MPEEKSVLLQHMLLSHHGQPEFGAAVVPMCAEAELLSLIDTMDSRMEIYRETLEEVPEGPSANGSSPWTKRSTTTDERPGGSGLRRDLREGRSGPPPGPVGPCPPPGAGIDPLPRMERAPGGKPFFPDLPQVRFSLSHSHGAAVCAVHDREVGVDVELLRPAPRRLGAGMTDEEFFRLWTAREATAKRAGRGLEFLLARRARTPPAAAGRSPARVSCGGLPGGGGRPRPGGADRPGGAGGNARRKMILQRAPHPFGWGALVFYDRQRALTVTSDSPPAWPARSAAPGEPCRQTCCRTRGCPWPPRATDPCPRPTGPRRSPWRCPDPPG